jgi:uncharacterized protein YjdB
MRNYFKKQIEQSSVFGRCGFAQGAIFSGNCGAQSRNMFLRLRNGAAAVLSGFIFCVIGVTGVSGQVLSPVEAGWAGEGMQYVWHPDDGTLFIMPSSDTKGADQWNYRMVHNEFATLCLSDRMRSNIHTLVIEGDTRRIGHRAFSGLINLSKIYFGSSLKIIDDNAFSACAYLTKIVLPENINTIRFRAFCESPLEAIVTARTAGFSIIQEDIALGDQYEFFSRQHSGSGLTRLYIPDGSADKYQNAWPWYYLFHYYGTAFPTVFATGISLDKPSVTLKYPYETTAQLTAHVSPSNTTDDMVRWYSSNENIVHVSQDGKITARQPGKVTIRAMAYNHGQCNLETSCLVVVTELNGSCGVPGDTIHWAYDINSGGVLTISGSGIMQDYAVGSVANASAGEASPFFDFGTDIKKVVIGEGITHIGSNAFSLLTGLETVEIPSTVSSIGNGAFQQCTGLLKAVILSGTVFNAADVFNGVNLGNLTIYVPEGVDKLYSNLSIFKNVEIAIGISLNKTALELAINQSETLLALISTNMSDSEITSFEWSSSDATVATVSTGGTIMPWAAGDAVITVKTVGAHAWTTASVHVLNSDATLRVILLNGETLSGFASNKTVYNFNVPYSESIEISAAASHDSATVSGTGRILLSNRDNQIKIAVNAEDVTTVKIYTLNVKRLNNDATLKAIRINGDPLPDFKPNTLEYAVDVTGTTNIDITTEASDANSVCTGAGKYTISKDTTIHIVNVSEDKTDTCEYTVSVTRLKSTNVKLSHINLITADSTIQVEVMDNVAVYAVTVRNSVDSIEIHVETEDPNASVDSINGIKPLIVGVNRFDFTVTAENERQKTNYTLLITRLKAVSDNAATLKSLSITGLEFSFSPDTYSYELSLPDSITTIEINAVPNQAGATVNISGDTTNIADSSVIRITVIAPDSTTTLVYTITVKRTAPVVPGGISKVAASAVQVYFDRQALHIHSPVAERISVYSVTGVLLRNFDKRAGSSTVSPTGGSAGSPINRMLIIKGSSGWARKIVVND